MRPQASGGISGHFPASRRRSCTGAKSSTSRSTKVYRDSLMCGACARVGTLGAAAERSSRQLSRHERCRGRGSHDDPRRRDAERLLLSAADGSVARELGRVTWNLSRKARPGVRPSCVVGGWRKLSGQEKGNCPTQAKGAWAHPVEKAPNYQPEFGLLTQPEICFLNRWLTKSGHWILLRLL
jgi:hypothetical protein